MDMQGSSWIWKKWICWYRNFMLLLGMLWIYRFYRYRVYGYAKVVDMEFVIRLLRIWEFVDMGRCGYGKI
jgi:hypothetical protein